jgi:hypothetical protein
MATQTDDNSKDIKEVTLYNFATIRNADYLNPEAVKKNISLIQYDESRLLPEDSKLESEKLPEIDNYLDFEIVSFKKKSNYNTGKYGGEKYQIIPLNETGIQVYLNSLFDRILNLYKTKEDDFREIQQLLEGIDFENGLKADLPFLNTFQKNIYPNEESDNDRIGKKTHENEIIRNIWMSLVFNIKCKNDFKEKEIATNLLRFFHLRKYAYLIDDEKKEERWGNLTKLLNAQIVIPEELFPKNETIFYGKKNRIAKLLEPSTEFVNEHERIVSKFEENIEDYKSDIATENVVDLDQHDANTTSLKFEKKLSIKNAYYQFFLPYVATIKFLNDKAYFFASIDLSNINKNENKIIEYAFLKIRNKRLPLKIHKFTLNHFVIYCEVTIPKPVGPIDDDLIENIEYSLELDITDENYSFRSIKSQMKWISDKENNRYQDKGYLVIDDGKDYYGNAFAPSGYGIQMLGIADYRKVVSTISRYIPAEVAHIENLMSGEFREKVTTHETTTEITEFESTETEKENLNETTTNDRFQMQNEVAQILNEQRNNNTTASAGYSGGGYSANITTGASTQNSKEQSNKQAITQAKEITNKAVEKIVSKVKKERTTKITEKFIDVNKYGFDNRGNKEHVSGVYRHINAVYRNRICNYGKRLTYEFSIPEPALVHRVGTEIIEDDKLLVEIINEKKPCNPKEVFQSYNEITQSNIENFIVEFKLKKPKKFLEEFNISIPERSIPAGTTLFFKNSDIDKSVYTLQDGNSYELSDYYPVNWSIDGWVEYQGHDDGYVWVNIDDNSFQFNFGTDEYGGYSGGNEKVNIVKKAQPFKTNQTQTQIILNKPIVSAKISKFSIKFKLREELIKLWKKEQYDIILEAYQIEKSKYDDKIKKIIDAYKKKKFDEKKAQIEANKNNPKSALRNRQIEIISLKRNCLLYLIDDSDEENEVRKFGTNLIRYNKDFENLRVQLSQKLDEYTAFVRFLEQAFEWENMSYSFYPYFWGDKKRWFDNYNQTCDDPLHQAFLQAGMARVIVTVRPGFEDAVNLYMTTGKIWMGGNLPVYGSSLFVSIADELKNGNEEYTIDGEWESVLPTNLIAIQSSGVSIRQEGLPDLRQNDGLGKVEPKDATPKRLDDDADSETTPKKKKFLGLF